MEPERYQQILENIRYCKQLPALEYEVQRILQGTGFGQNSLGDSEIDVNLTYLEIAACLQETDQIYFQREIELLSFAHQQVQMIQAGQVPEQPTTIQPWEFFT